jgi:hypothetical protein
LIADKGFDNDNLRAELAAAEVDAVIQLGVTRLRDRL